MKKAILLGILVLWSNLSNAAVRYIYVAGEKLVASVSNHALNRIEFSGQTIREVIGDDSKYQLISDKYGGNIFVLPKVAVGKTIGISLITNSGVVQDMELVASNVGSQNIIIEVIKPENTKSEIEKIAELMRYMKGEEKGKYYVKEHNIIMAQKNPDIEFRKVKTYQFGELIGVVGEVRNKTTKPMKLAEDNFNNIFARTMAVSIGKGDLRARGKSRVFVITKGKAE